MKFLIALSAVVLAGCGARSSMEGCAQGTEGCYCFLDTSCYGGLSCIDGVCENASVAGPAGGTVGTGGHVGSGGQIGFGGFVGSGGQVGRGGNVGAGGVTGDGGSVWYGGTTARGGVIGTGVGGTPGAGGSTYAATFPNGRAEGAMTGYGWVALGALDTLSSPTCMGVPITQASPCTTSTTWGTSSTLCISGTIPALPANPTAVDYQNNWGILVAASVTEPAGGGLGVALRGATFNLTGSPLTNLRAEVHRKGDAVGNNYCANLSPGTAIAFTAFNTSCWDGLGQSLTPADVPNLDWLGVMVVSSFFATTVSRLCLNAIIFN